RAAKASLRTYMFHWNALWSEPPSSFSSWPAPCMWTSSPTMPLSSTAPHCRRGWLSCRFVAATPYRQTPALISSRSSRGRTAASKPTRLSVVLENLLWVVSPDSLTLFGHALGDLPEFVSYEYFGL